MTQLSEMYLFDICFISYEKEIFAIQFPLQLCLIKFDTTLNDIPVQTTMHSSVSVTITVILFIYIYII